MQGAKIYPHNPSESADLKLKSEARLFHAAISVVIILVSALQAAFLLIDHRWTILHICEMGLIVATMFLSIRWIRSWERRVGWLLILSYCSQVAIFVADLFLFDPSPAPRLLQVAILLMHGSVIGSFLLSKLISPLKALSLCAALAFAIFLCETILVFLTPERKSSPSGTEWVGSVDFNPAVGELYIPHSLLKIYYPSNPQNYFKKEDPKEGKWSIYVTRGHVADVSYPSDRPNDVRIDIRETQNAVEANVSLCESHLKAQKDHSYLLRFRARADAPRNLVVSSRQGFDLVKRINVSEDWNSFEETLKATEDNIRGDICFDVANSKVAVELSSVQLYDAAGSHAIEPDLSTRKYVVDYRFNSMGCRGPDYAVPRPPETRRILALGDSFTLGVGVYQNDTFTTALQRLLNENAGAYEVINCGISGFGTKEERLFYETFGQKYQPEIVLLVMVYNDDISFVEEVKKGYVGETQEKPELFRNLSKLDEARHKRPERDYTKCVKEILTLDQEVREQGSRLAVILFRDTPDYAGSTEYGKTWNQLQETVTNGLQGKNIPMLDLGESLFEKYFSKDLVVDPAVDRHPNQIAHGIAARAILKFLQKEQLIR